MEEILAHCDHTLLDPTATEEQIRGICDDALRFQTASVCIPPSYVRFAADYLGGRIKVCTVIGFPNGYNSTTVKCSEAAEAVVNGADEIDMVVNLGWVKDGKWDEVLKEIDSVKVSIARRTLKVIVETCRLTEEEKVRITEVVDTSTADYIKTSTGFSTGGATFEDIKLFADHIKNGTKIKAAGGIKTLEDADTFLTLGADRLGTSRIVKLAKEALE